MPERRSPSSGRGESWFEALFCAEYQRLCTCAIRYVGRAAVAEELVQDAFLQLWSHRDELAEEAVRTYLYRSVRNACLDQLKREKVRRNVTSTPNLDDAPGLDSPETDYRVQEVDGAVRKAIDALPDRQREIFILSRDAGLSYKEIAGVLSISVKTVETQMGRALKFLREHLRYLLIS
ncbi:MAG: RNA polymerase sigma-70 factor [Bacteroidota bacterium]